MMASTTSATAAAAAFGTAATAKPRGSSSSAICPRVSTGGRRRSGVVRCDAGVETQVQAVAKAASIAALEQFKISADRESLALRLSSNLQLLLPFLLLWMRDSSRPGDLFLVRDLRNFLRRVEVTAAVGISFGLLVWYRSKGVGGLGKKKE